MIPVFLYTAVFGYLSIIRHASFESFEDLALFDQLLWNIRHGRGPVTTISGNMHLLFHHHFFGEHFSPILYLLAPIAGITKGPEALLILQAFVVGLTAVPVGLWVSRVMGRSDAGLAAAWFWIAIPALWVGVLYDFHMDCLFPLLFFCFILSMHRKQISVWLWAALVLSIKEDAAIYLFFAALATGWLYNQKRTGGILAAASLLYALVVVFVVIPRFSATGSHLLGNRIFLPVDCGGWIGWMQAVLANPERWKALQEHLHQFGYFPLMGWVAALPWMASVGIAWLSRDTWQSLMTMHYPLMSYPLMFFAMVEGIRVLNRVTARHSLRVRFLTKWSSILWISAAIVANWTNAKPQIDDVMRSASPSRAERLSESRQLIAKISSAVSVAATQTTLAHVARREKLFLMFDPVEADTVVLQTYLPCEMSYEPDRYREHMGYFLQNRKRYQAVDFSDHLIVFHQNPSHQKRVDRSWYFTEFIDNTEFLAIEKEQKKDPDAINGLAVKWDAETSSMGPSLKWPKTLSSGVYNFHIRARASCETSSDTVMIQITEQDGRRVCGKGTILEKDQSYQVTTVNSVLMTGRGVAIDTTIPASCTLWIDRVWVEPLG
mgnify:CR=1 FL=1